MTRVAHIIRKELLELRQDPRLFGIVIMAPIIQLTVLGYAATWPDGANESFLAGDTDTFGTTGSFVVHPPLGKYLIGIGMALFGAESSFGWRIATAR